MRGFLLMVLACGVMTPLPAAAQRQKPNLTGSWVLRVDSTARPAPDSVRAAPDTVVPDSGRGESDSAGARRGEPRRSRPVGPSPRERSQIGLLLGMAQPVRAFAIAQSDTAITITNEDGFSYTVRLDGRKTTIPLSDSVSVEMQGKWDDGALILTYQPTGGGKVTESYHLADSRRYLRLEVEVTHKAMFRRYWQTRMYRRSDSPGS
ncbi:MAG TPA: hypothetical protein VFH97_02395 [Gemmatimonadales bacterium]|nr:hypothetical protein [Gemmatimonadales bacterium]